MDEIDLLLLNEYQDRYTCGFFDICSKEPAGVSMWDNSFKDDGNDSLLKKIFEKVLSLFLPDLLSDYLITYISSRFHSDSKLIEMGCGKATASKGLAQKKNYRIVLVDYNAFAIAKAMQSLQQDTNKGLFWFIRGDFYQSDLKFPPQYFDVAHNVGVIEHFDDPIKSVIQMKKIAKEVVCVIPTSSIYWKIGTWVRKAIEKDASLWTAHTRYYHEDELIKIFKRARLKNISTQKLFFMGIPYGIFARGET